MEINATVKIWVTQQNDYPKRLRLYVPAFRKDWIAKCKQLPTCLYHYEERYWTIVFCKKSLRTLYYTFESALAFDFDWKAAYQEIPEELIYNKKKKREQKAPKKDKIPLPAIHERSLELFEQAMLLKRNSHRTAKSYRNYIKSFLYSYPDKDIREIDLAERKKYIVKTVKERDLSVRTQNVLINALKFLYEHVADEPREKFVILRPKKEKKIPQVLSLQEVGRLLDAAENIKHKAILMLIYSAGLRLGEVVNLKVQDIQTQHNRIFIDAGKGAKDRYTLLSVPVLKLLRQYYLQLTEKPTDFLFMGQYGGQYSTRSVQHIFTNAKVASGINRRATVHTLRHSFATHLCMNGVDIHYVKQLLGHSNIKTTEIYLHISKDIVLQVQSPIMQVLGEKNK